MAAKTPIVKEGAFDADVRNAINSQLASASSAAPASATAAGTAGDIAYDATHLYVCIATNTWVRATFATW